MASRQARTCRAARDTYRADDHFYQCDGGAWTTSKAIAGPWTLIAQKLVPDSARGRHTLPREAVTARLPPGRGVVYEPKLEDSARPVPHHPIFFVGGCPARCGLCEIAPGASLELHHRLAYDPPAWPRNTSHRNRRGSCCALGIPETSRPWRRCTTTSP